MKNEKIIFQITTLIAACIFIVGTYSTAQGQTIFVPQSAPYTEDTNTVLLEHFDGTTTGSITGGVTYTNGIFGQGARLSWNNCVVFNMGALSQGTVEFWARANSFTNSNGGSSFVTATLWANNWSTFVIGLSQSNSAYSEYVDVNDVWQGMPNGLMTTNNGNLITTNKWHHYATTWGGKGFHFYVDGNLVYSNSATGGQYSPTSVWQVGANSAAGNDGSGFDGMIDELRISSVQRDFAPAPILNINTAVYVNSTSLIVGSNYQFQLSTDLINWSNQGPVFTATNSYWRPTNYWDVVNRNQLFFRLVPQ